MNCVHLIIPRYLDLPVLDLPDDESAAVPRAGAADAAAAGALARLPRPPLRRSGRRLRLLPGAVRHGGLRAGLRRAAGLRLHVGCCRGGPVLLHLPRPGLLRYTQVHDQRPEGEEGH